MRVVAIDPGYSNGAIALITDDKNLDVVLDLPLSKPVSGGGESEVNYLELKKILSSLKPDICVVELVGGMPKDSPVTSFRFGFSAGVIRCAMAEVCDDVRVVSAGRWKRAAMIFKHKKSASVDEAIEKYPHLKKHLIVGRKRMIDRADAVLIADSVIHDMDKK